MDRMALCQICVANFYTPAELHKHKMASHSESLLQCKKCPVTTMGAKNLNNHMQTHSESPCSFCFKMIKTNTLKHHIATCKANSDSLIVRCDVCPFETPRKYTLKRHVKTHQKIKFDVRKVAAIRKLAPP